MKRGFQLTDKGIRVKQSPFRNRAFAGVQQLSWQRRFLWGTTWFEYFNTESPDSCLGHIWMGWTQQRYEPAHNPVIDNKFVQIRYAWRNVVDCLQSGVVDGYFIVISNEWRDDSGLDNFMNSFSWDINEVIPQSPARVVHNHAFVVLETPGQFGNDIAVWSDSKQRVLVTTQMHQNHSDTAR